MNAAPEVQSFIAYQSKVYSSCDADVDDNKQDAMVKVMELESSGIKDIPLQRTAIHNMFRDKARAKFRKERLDSRYIRIPKVETYQPLWDEKKIEDACSQLSELEAQILRNMTDPSPEYKEALFDKYKGRNSVRLDEGVLAKVLGIDPSTLSRHKDNMLIKCLSHYGACYSSDFGTGKYTDG